MVEYYVEYIDELGELQSEQWTEYVLNYELARGDVKITHIELAYSLQEELGLV